MNFIKIFSLFHAAFYIQLNSARVLAYIQNNKEENKTVKSSEKQTTIRRQRRRKYTEDEKIYICAKCAKSYPTRGNLNRHIRLKCH